MERPGWRGEDTSLRFTQKQNAAVRHRETRERASDNVFVSIVSHRAVQPTTGPGGQLWETPGGGQRLRETGGRRQGKTHFSTAHIKYSAQTFTK